jgi:hypothetical protein
MPSKRQAVRCTGKRRNGSPCAAYAINGSTVCWAHGGNLPRVKAKAAVSLAQEQARAELAALDVEPVGDPLRQLALLAGQAVAWKDTMAERVNMLAGLRYEGAGAGEQLRAEVALWERALDRCGKFLVSMARLRIDDRLAKVTEAQADLIERAVTAALASEGLDLAAQDRARHVVSRHLRAVPAAGGQDAG